MRAIPLAYNLRNLWTRRLTTFLTASGMALVVFVFTAILMLAAGLEKTLVETGTPQNVIVIRKGADSEVQSGIEREQAAVIQTLPEVALGPAGSRLLARELLVLVNLSRQGSSHSNIAVRGTEEQSLALRPQVRIVEGRAPRPGSTDIMVGASIARRFDLAGVGGTVRFGLRNWTVSGIFDAGATGFSSELWGDGDQLMQTFRRTVYSSVLFRLRDQSEFQQVKARIETDPRLSLEARRENRYYADQSEMMAKFLRILGLSLTIIFSLGAIIGGMITMYSSVANRTAEIGTLRAIGFQRRNILYAFLVESLLLGFIGGVAGLFFASLMQFLSVSTVNFQTFSELSFKFALTPSIAVEAMAFALAMGFLGGVLPAFRASRMNIVDSLRAG